MQETQHEHSGSSDGEPQLTSEMSTPSITPISPLPQSEIPNLKSCRPMLLLA